VAALFLSRTLACSVLLIAGCSTQSQQTNLLTRPVNKPAPAEDRAAIHAMLGNYKVSFAFDETVVLSDDYERTAPKRSGAHEVVLLVEESPQHIVLQHLLITGTDTVIKHWRQDWIYEASHRLEFSDEQTWQRVALSPEQTQGRWTQCVYGVADEPRYCGTGPWNHRYGQATWTSDRSWRPLPRREYSTRDDYNALNVENRHTITPHGWTHEQDNSKVRRTPGASQQVLAREFGFNDYKHSEDFDASPALRYWAATQDYWTDVRARWSSHFEAGGVQILTGPDGAPLVNQLLQHGDDLAAGTAISWNLSILFADYVRSLNTPYLSIGKAGSSDHKMTEQAVQGSAHGGVSQ
jgi:hypothetical protein